MILVTGATGFLGTHLMQALESSGLASIGIGLEQVDLRQTNCLARFENEGINHVIHLAAKTFVPESWENPATFFESNVFGTANVLEFCRKVGVSITFVSGYVYGHLNFPTQRSLSL